MKVTVKYFGSVKDDAGTVQELVDVPDGTTVLDLIDRLKRDHSGLAGRKGQILYALNQAYTDGKAVAKDGDELALFPIVSGG